MPDPSQDGQFANKGSLSRDISYSSIKRLPQTQDKACDTRREWGFIDAGASEPSRDIAGKNEGVHFAGPVGLKVPTNFQGPDEA
ncbi:hypothetical protein O181_022213 [Austropuccinia psidii MF-1]|uniref:Uncharacterized protein n=1 Tax=Austropuccinia psidii MF-1 TaxID=1389203 RepID=A0A9Q3GW48_9BASI|nr:hypothetical protein [Austropuccinia psidii MF-1]